MGRKSVTYLSATCSCGGEGCEECTCHECGDWLTTSDGDGVCNSCKERMDREYEEDQRKNS